MRLGIDLGGTKIEGAILDRAGAIAARRRIDAPHGDYQATLDAIAGLVAELEAGAGVTCSLGVGIPGTVSAATGLVKNANSTWLIGHPLDRDLAARLDRPVRLANDANCFALSEAVDGAGREFGAVFGVILGTGVGGGLAVGKTLIGGANGIAGEWGHNPLPWPAPGESPGAECYCGLSGCIETFLCAAGLLRAYGGGKCRTAPEIAEAAAAGDRAASAAVETYANRLARGLASVINLFDPEVIVLGGGLSNIGRLYRAVPEMWGEWVFSDTVETALVRNMHGDSSGVRGAAWLWPAEAGNG
ncbi:MAG: ROK family protein [bacterium]|nr:ROK family protein [bacterium]